MEPPPVVPMLHARDTLLPGFQSQAPAPPGPAHQPLPVRANPRKPQKAPAPRSTPEPEPAGIVPPKRQRRAPAWLASEFKVEEVPEAIAEGFKKTEPEEQKAVKGKRGGASTSARMTNWRLLDKKTMLVEMEWQGKRFKGYMQKTGVAPTAGVVLEHYEPNQQKVAGANNKDLCAMCNQPLIKEVYPADPELQKVVRVAVSSNWVTHVHLTCGLWAPEVFEDKHGNLVNVASSVRRSRALRCMVCRDRGASLGCYQTGCQRVYHLPCAHSAGCLMDDDNFTIYCPQHKWKHTSRS